MNETILITGTSGFIGFHVAKKLLDEGYKIIGFDNENDYYDVNLKIARRKILEQFPNFIFFKGNLQNLKDLERVFKNNKINKVVNLAAQAGVRYSLINPYAYIQSNIVGFHNLIELAKQYQIENFIYASSSSVYGKNNKQPFSIKDKVDHPISLYAATKKSDELIAHVYSHLFGLPTIGLRFFTVYGPRGRPDMAMLIFADKIMKGEAIDVFNNGDMRRDFTYIDDIVDGVIKAIHLKSKYEIFNLGSDNPVELEYMISLLEKELGTQAQKNYLPLQPGDIPSTSADIEYTKQKLRREPKYKIEKGIENLIKRYKKFYQIKNK